MHDARTRTPLHPLAGTLLVLGVLLVLAALLLNPLFLVPGLLLLAGGATYVVLDRRRQGA